MSISPAQLMTVLGTSGPATAAGRQAGAPVTPSNLAADIPAEPRGTARSEPTGPQLSTALRIDDQRHIYYEVINERSGDVVFEIPPEQIRKLGEGMKESLAGQEQIHSLDVKS